MDLATSLKFGEPLWIIACGSLLCFIPSSNWAFPSALNWVLVLFCGFLVFLWDPGSLGSIWWLHGSGLLGPFGSMVLE
jgi:hypothetical protein